MTVFGVLDADKTIFFLGNYEDVNGSLWVYVAKCEDVGVFVHDAWGDLLADYFVEYCLAGLHILEYSK